MKKVLKISLFIICLIVLTIFTSNIVYNIKNSNSQWKECYSIAIFYSENKFTKQETRDKKTDYGTYYKKIYVKANGSYYTIKTIDWENNVEIKELDRRKFQIIIEYC